ncbi:App1 family protein [Formosa sp. PL04]|uniref:App1 family protein n=1 Tax=Formosa sp. PL04 TaxID=3081755 RepID=UPI002980CC47|nr:phosphatase domain-containing protein [Formosa sp. PL04]MDW5287404.1 phosphatase domain-containing protein [Formosa sp. PL04]
MFKKDPLQIIAFQSYGSSSHFYLRGRALEDETIDLEQKGLFKLLINTYKRFESDEIKDVELNLRLPNDKVLKVKTDSHGYFKSEETLQNLNELTNNEGWLQIIASYSDVNIKREITNANRFPAEILIPSQTASFGVISDIDDTIIHTGVASILKWRVFINTFFKGAFKRIPLEGAAAFYHMLHRGISGTNANPIFYVSHSPWNLYRYLKFFLKANDFPKGPILLRSMNTIFMKKKANEKPQKQKEIINILKMYPELNFILIGDSGEHDADIYIEIAELYPKRILAIYLRCVGHKEKMLRVKGIFDAYKTTPALLVHSSKEAIDHAKRSGFIQ